MVSSPQPRMPGRPVYILGRCPRCGHDCHSGEWLAGDIDSPEHYVCWLDAQVAQGRMPSRTAQGMKADIAAMEAHAAAYEEAHAAARRDAGEAPPAPARSRGGKRPARNRS